jgi:hypothetical protein
VYSSFNLPSFSGETSTGRWTDWDNGFSGGANRHEKADNWDQVQDRKWCTQAIEQRQPHRLLQKPRQPENQVGERNLGDDDGGPRKDAARVIVCSGLRRLHDHSAKCDAHDYNKRKAT